MRKKALLILSITLVLLCLSGSTNNIFADGSRTPHAASVCEHHTEVDQIYVENHISVLRESKYIIIEHSPTNLLEYYTQIWKPPVNS